MAGFQNRLHWCDMSRLPFQIKICGVTTLDDATCAIGYYADAIGLNFYSRSKRNVTIENAAEIALFDSTTVPIVGVFVNHSIDEIATILSKMDLAWIQLHGDETPEFVKQVKAESGLPIMRALRWGREGSKPIDEYLKQCAEEGCLPDALLIDAHVKGEYGGTGETADWEAIARWRDSRPFDIPLVLAGGLTPENVAAAIRTVRPDAVDTASGVESAPGRKDAERVRKFIEEAKRAFAALG